MNPLARYREQFPILERYVYLNHAGVSPCSVPVRDAVSSWMTQLAQHGLELEAEWQATEASARGRAAQLVGATPAEIALVHNTSEGLGLVAEGISWKEGDEVCVCTAVEYPSNVYPWLHLARRGVRVCEIPATRGGVTPEAVKSVLTDRTRLVSVSAVQYATGHRTPLEELGALCADAGVWLCVDGIQALGAFEILPKKWGIHFLSADSHKWMLGVSGAGFLFIDERVLDAVEPTLVGWKSTTDAFDFDTAHFELRSDAAKLEEGSPPYALVAGLDAALGLIQEVGLPTISEAVTALVDRIADGLGALGCDVSPDKNERAGIVTFTVPGEEPTVTAARIHEAGFRVSVRRNRVRVSPHFYNSIEEIDRFVSVALPSSS